MHILLTNDDGIHAPGLWALYKRFEQNHTVSVIAPDREQSAVGHGITLNRPLRVSTISMNGTGPGYAVNGIAGFQAGNVDCRNQPRRECWCKH